MPVGGQHGAGWAGRGVKCGLYPSTNIPYQAPVGVCTHSTAPAPRGAFGRVMALSKPAPFLPPFQPPPSPFSTPRCSMGIYIHQTSACALQRGDTDLAQPSWLSPEVNLPPCIIPNGADWSGGVPSGPYWELPAQGRSQPVLPFADLGPHLQLRCCIPGDEGSPSLAVTAALGPSWHSFGEQSTRFAERCRPRVPPVPAQCKPKVPPRCVAIPRVSWPPLLGDIGRSAGAPADHCGKPGMKLQLGLFKAQTKRKNQGGLREKATLRIELWASGSRGGEAQPLCYKPAGAAR